jgi:hypothetical protein
MTNPISPSRNRLARARSTTTPATQNHCQYDVNIGSDNIIGHWFGKINIAPANAGDITFFTASDDGSKLWVDGVQVVDNNFFQGVTERSGLINLTPGLHDIEVGFYEGGSALACWSPGSPQAS